IKQIAQLKIAALQQRLRNSKGIDLQITDAAVDALVDKGYEPAFGARPLERMIRDKVESKVADVLLNSSDTKNITIDAPDILQ
ncbi:ATP-dependent Clp protease ATP-binding subunit, partial [Patescibacteria group bacterium]|nr:ATP-dependent Clp protease ATP-binding subunit [Patescibacteria group bacterium]